VDSRVELAADEEVVDGVACLAAEGEFAELRVAWADGEAVEVDVDREEEGEGEVRGKEGEVIGGDPGPEEEGGAVEVGAEGAGEEEGEG
jgi:hypothetical protein